MSGYTGVGPEVGTFVSVNVAFEYALERCLNGAPEDKEEFKEMLVEWFFSGNWIKEG